jgi:hypothetical protein
MAIEQSKPKLFQLDRTSEEWREHLHKSKRLYDRGAISCDAYQRRIFQDLSSYWRFRSFLINDENWQRASHLKYEDWKEIEAWMPPGDDLWYFEDSTPTAGFGAVGIARCGKLTEFRLLWKS